MLLRDALGETLRDARVRQNRTLRDVSAAANVSLGYLSEVERGRKEASSELLAAICDALAIELGDVLGAAGHSLKVGTAPSIGVRAKQAVTANSIKAGMASVDKRPRMDPTLKIVLPYGSGRPQASLT